MLYEVIDSRPANRGPGPSASSSARAPGIRRRPLFLPPRRTRAARDELRGTARQAHRAGWPVGGGKTTVLDSFCVLRSPVRQHPDRRQDIATVSRESLRGRSRMSGRSCKCREPSARTSRSAGSCTETEIVAAPSRHAHDFIMSFPQGYETGREHGMQLSGASASASPWRAR